ncbi:hypothetical protein KS4_10390 [Poriferisphaera corsica]|uniref:DUF2203 domain-containing protein n=1 Tax=Poriferisphaera corsica TaxID=2528020 RepID=A0A517YS03_9BACT|nr:DUF2203 domain-containing protein [Poriferisphaera corsica]QDU33000.1 hypothetical protein KS4_10390 [Poriferisphaera corsica]
MPYNQAQVKADSNADHGKKFFSIEEANNSLGYVRRIVDDITIVYTKIVEMRRRLEELGESQFSLSPDSEYEKLMDRLGLLVDELHSMGAELKDFEKGLVDFPSRHKDREVLLCWKQGEDKVEHWHEVDTGYAGRQSIADLK